MISKLQTLSKMTMPFLMVLFSVWTWGQYSITGTGSANTYTQNFDNFRGTAATLPTNWSISGSYNGTASNQVLIAGSATPSPTVANGNNCYAGKASSISTDYSILQKQATSGSSTFTFSAVNNTNNTIDGFIINWNVEQFAVGGRATQLDFKYRLNGGSYVQTGMTGTSLYTATTGTTASTFQYVNSTPAPYSIVITGISLPANQTVDFQFTIANGTGSGSNAYVGIDDFSVYATAPVFNSPVLSTSSTPASLGSVYLGASSSSQAYTITNNGAVDAIGVSVQSSDSQFTISGLSSTTVPANGGTATYNVTFTPTLAGAQSTTIGVSSVTSGSNNPTYTLTGTGIEHADHIAFVGVPVNGNVNVNLTSFSIQALTPSSIVDTGYTGNVTVSKVSGSGAISGTLTKSFVSGVATFNDIQFDAASTYTISATDGTLNTGASGNITISTVPVVLAGWDFTGVSGDATTATVTTYNANLNEVVDNKNITRGAGAVGSSGGNSFRTTGFQNNGIAVTNTDYFQNIVKVKPGYKVSLSKINARFVGTNTYYANSGVSSQYAYSLDGTNFTLIGTPFNVTSINSVYTVDLSGVTALQNIDANTTVYFRYYASGQTSTGGWGYSSSTSGVNGLEFTGNITENTVLWQNGAWSTSPSSITNAVIDDNYNGVSFTTAGLAVNNGKTLTITNGNTVTATNVTNNGSIVVENGGNFIQSTGGIYANSGNFTVNKNTTSAANKYVFWASPIVSQNMYGIHTSVPQYVMTYDTITDYYTTLSNPATSTPGVGYSVKMPTASAVATFGGTSKVPNNGDVAVTLSTVGNTYNLVGNPYPSNLNLNTFYNNGGNNVGSTFWFWDNTSNSVTTQTGNTTTNVGYATYNAAGSGTWTEAPSSLASHSGNAAAIGQGFIVEATGATATFTNAMRVSATGNTFNKLNGNDSGKFWLKLATPYGSHTTLAVNYEAGALNGYDKYDSRAMGTGSDAFYSTVGSEKLVIQGKAPFTIDDVVLLGNKHFDTGNFVISLTKKEGLFNNGQAIYLHDKDLGTYTNLQSGNYSFSANAGEFANRFEIVYKLGVLGTQEIEKGTFVVYRDGEGFVARNSKNIEKLEIFDASGRKVMELKPNASSVNFELELKGMYVLRAISFGKEYTKKLIK